VAADFDCGAEPAVPPQTTTHAASEAYAVALKAFGETCQGKLYARGGDAGRFGLIGKGGQ